MISTKTFQFLAMGKPTIVGDNPATRELLVSGETVYAVPMNDPEALADAILLLATDVGLREEIALGGYTVFQNRLGSRLIAEQLSALVRQVL